MNTKLLHSEKFFAIFTAIIVILFNLLPYAYHHYNPPPADRIYIGAFPIIFDKATYLTEINQGKEGSWLMINKYTTEFGKGTLLHTFYLFLGHIAKIFDMAAETIFFASRFIFGGILLFAVFYFLHYFIQNKTQRKLAYFFAFFASGLGWITENSASPDLWLPDAIPMVRFSYFPHLMVGNILFLAILFLLYNWFKKPASNSIIVAGVLTFILNFVVPFSSLFVYLFTISLLILTFKSGPLQTRVRSFFDLFAGKKSPPSPAEPWQRTNAETGENWADNLELKNEAPQTHARGISYFFGGAESAEAEKFAHSSMGLHPWFSAKADNMRKVLLFFAISLPSFIYMLYIVFADPLWKMVEKQDMLFGPDLANLATGYGLVLFFSLPGLWLLRKRDKLLGLFFSLWILEVLSFSLLPAWIYPMKRRFLETAFYVPLAIAASFGILGIYQYFAERQIKNLRHKFFLFFTIFITPFMLMGNIQVWLRFNYSIRQTNDPQFYLPSATIEAMKWLRYNSKSDSVILSSFFTGNVIPYYADRTAYFGHIPFTLNIKEKMKKVSDFYSGHYSSEQMLNFLKEEKIDYVFYSDREMLEGVDFNQYDFLKPVYENKGIIIYEAL